MLKKGAVGGIQVRNFEGRDEFIKEVKEAADYPVLICADMEHGFPGSELSVPHTMSISATGSTEYAYELARTVAIEAKAAGYNVVWGPVVDIAAPGAQCRNARCFSDDVNTVTDYAIATIKGYQNEGMIVSAKHFLNPPDILDDTHIREGVKNLSKLALCAKTKEGVKVELDKDTNKLFILLCENTYEYSDSIGELVAVSSYSRKNVELKKQEIEKKFPGAKVMIVSEFPHKVEIMDMCHGIAEADETIFFTFNHTTSYQASDDITGRIKYIIASYADKISTVVHVGDPYVLKNFKKISRVLWSTTGGDCEKWAIKALKGEYEPTGILPVCL